jgi:mono/diheme cytochrome c family protein
MRHALLWLVLPLVASLTALADEGALRGPQELDTERPGYAMYRQYCAVCHGIFADGNGLVAPVLLEQPPDLRRLSAQYGTPLSRPRLARTIDGSDPILAHGSREMPIWGTRLYEALPNPMPDTRQRGAILTILDYLESIQKTGP